MASVRDILLGLTNEQMSHLFYNPDVNIAVEAFSDVGIRSPIEDIVAAEIAKLQVTDVKNLIPPILQHIVQQTVVDNRGARGRDEHYDETFINNFALKVNVWLNDPKNSFTDEQKEEILSKLILQVARVEAKRFFFRVSEGLTQGTNEHFQLNSPLSNALLKYVPPSFKASLESRVQTEVVAPFMTKIQRVQILRSHYQKLEHAPLDQRKEMFDTHNEINKVTKDIQEKERERKNIKKSIANADADRSNQIISASLKKLRPGFFARNFTSWGKKAEQIYQRILTAESRSAGVEVVINLVQQLKTVYDNTQSTMTGVEKLLYQGSVQARQSEHNFIEGALASSTDLRENENRQKIEDLEQAMRDQRMQRAGLLEKQAELIAKAIGTVEFDAPDLDHSSHLMQALSHDAVSETIKPREKKQVSWGDEEEGGKLHEEAVFSEQDPSSAVEKISETPKKPEDEARSSSDEPPQENRGMNP